MARKNFLPVGLQKGVSLSLSVDDVIDARASIFERYHPLSEVYLMGFVMELLWLCAQSKKYFSTLNSIITMILHSKLYTRKSSKAYIIAIAIAVRAIESTFYY